jgi:regulation of enolase protein 1 (concanavalin A-like superfamily)
MTLIYRYGVLLYSDEGIWMKAGFRYGDYYLQELKIISDNLSDCIPFCWPFEASGTTWFNNQQLSILPTESIYGFLTILKINSDYFPKLH